ncbi:MAG: glycosyltransferase family 39 protein [Thermoguttaceae bacterium]
MSSAMGHFAFWEPTPDNYPNHLAATEAERLRWPSSRWVLVGLLLACLVPRAWMAMRIPSVCPDGVLYVRLAQAIDHGDFQAVFRDDMRLNVYPFILAAMHRLGFDWQTGGALWGVLISSLVALPLWGWIRRQFDHRVALAACLLYAVHPKAVEWSPELMRDPTFWFFFTLSLYVLWRAATELRNVWFLAAGAAITLATMTRVEGLFLLVPFVLWTFWRCLALPTGRGRLLGGALACVVIFPLLLAVADIAWTSSHAGSTMIRVAPLSRAQEWLESLWDGQSDEIAGHLTLGRMIWVFIPTMTRGLSPIFALLMFGGIWGWRRVWIRRDHQTLFYVALLVLGGIWIQLWIDRMICPRYAMPIVLMASPWAALGLLALLERTARFVRRFDARRIPQVVAVTTLLAAIVAANLTIGLTSNRSYFKTRRAEVEVGRWLDQNLPKPLHIVGPVGVASVIGFYADCEDSFTTYRRDAAESTIVALIRSEKADVVILRPSKQQTPRQCLALANRMKRQGWSPLGPDVLPEAQDEFYLLVRPNLLKNARQPTPHP